MKNIAYFMEDFESLSDYSGKIIISLTPHTSYELQKRNIKYNIIKDYYSENILRSRQNEFFLEQLQWFNDFDTFLKISLPYCRENNFNIAKANYMRIKYFVDSIIIFSLTLNYFFEKNNLQRIYYLNKKNNKENGKEWYSIFEFKSQSQYVFKIILEEFCKKYNVEFIDKILDSSVRNSLSSTNKIGYYFKNIAKKALKPFYTFIKYEKISKILHLTRYNKKTALFFLQAGSIDIDMLVKESIKQGYRVYIKEKESFIIRKGKW